MNARKVTTASSGEKPPLISLNWDVVGAHVPPPHVPKVIELPLLVAMRSVPLPVVVVPFVLEPSTDTISLSR